MIVGTAGHIDHGKTALVRALTGTDTDRLKEEKARGITLDLGFAYMPGPPGQAPIGFVDVPGHERLVRTMVAGASGIDFALLAIAADDGIMPQTREHLDVLCLLGLTRGLVAVTKVDRVDAARRDIVIREIETAFAATAFADFGTVAVSSRTGEGLDELRSRLMRAAEQSRERSDGGLFRMPVDRCFNLPGIGTVVTGTVMTGCIGVGDEVILLPGGKSARVRSLHAQNRPEASGHAGQRCALALAGSDVGKDTVGRGSWICAGETAFETARIDAELQLLHGEARPFRAGTPVHFHCGASDVPARTTLIGDGSLLPGMQTAAQIALDRALPLRTGDRFVLRDASGQRTIGGGSVLDPRAPSRRRRSTDRLLRLSALRHNPVEALAKLLAEGVGFEDFDNFAANRGLDPRQTDELLTELKLARLRHKTTTFVHTPEQWSKVERQVVDLLASTHAAHPDLPGMIGEMLRLALDPPPSRMLFEAVRDRLLADRVVAMQGHWLCLPGHVAALSERDRLLAEAIRPKLARERFRPPRVRDLSHELGQPEDLVRQICKKLARNGELTELARDHFFSRAVLAEMADIAADLTRQSATGWFGAAEFRDRLGNGRKLAIQILDFFDGLGFTRRTDDLRRVVKAPEVLFGRPAGGPERVSSAG